MGGHELTYMSFDHRLKLYNFMINVKLQGKCETFTGSLEEKT
jgi:hypothetical protein